MNAPRVLWLILGGATLFGLGFFTAEHWARLQRGGKAATEDGKPGSRRHPSDTPTGLPPNPPALHPATGSRAAATLGRDLLRQLAALKVTSQDPHSLRAIVTTLEKLREAGPAALPAIREFLVTGQDADYDVAAARNFRGGTVPLDFTFPPSLRLGLLEVVKNIGGAEAEAILLQELRTTGRGVEAAYLGAALQQLSPEKYREAALTAARDLLAMPLTTRAQNPLDRSDRDYLYGVLAAAGDRSQVAQAEAQLVLPNGQVDPGALRYLRQMLGDQVVAVATQAWQDPRVEANQREPLARTALAFVGTNPAAERLYRTAIDDPSLSTNARKNLIEDLNETGFADPKHLTSADLPLIQKRLALIDQLAPLATDRTNAAAFVEARKDLLNMRDSILATKPAPKK